MIYLARHGFRVFGVDIAPVGLGKAKRRAARLQVPIRTQIGDLRTYRLRSKFDVVFSSSALNHLPPASRAARFAHFKTATVPGGIHAVNAFLPSPQTTPAPDSDPSETPYRPGELAGYYQDWEILESRGVSFECHYRGAAPHRHAVEVVVARKPGGSPARKRRSKSEGS